MQVDYTPISRILHPTADNVYYALKPKRGQGFRE
jgi:hypothetical protein